ncbi:hypothetical protein CRENBAI_019655 [Crenichthys baileyi]|uniref:Uncharacterized protein n=1 Tax=Crenichthys baileyi TaxID=28760 RepID=A0AAV9RCR9_9TELE
MADQERSHELENHIELQWRGGWRREQEISSLKRRFLPGPFVTRPQLRGESEDQGKNPSSPRASLGGCLLFPAFSMVSWERSPGGEAQSQDRSFAVNQKGIQPQTDHPIIMQKLSVRASRGQPTAP